MRWNPSEYVAMVRHEAFKELEVSAGSFLGLAEHHVTFADCDFRENLSGGAVADGEVGARVPVLLAALGVLLLQIRVVRTQAPKGRGFHRGREGCDPCRQYSFSASEVGSWRLEMTSIFILLPPSSRCSTLSDSAELSLASPNQLFLF
jgi:hypothetical protein